MVKFHLLRSVREIYGHIILIFIPVALIAFFSYIYSNNIFGAGVDDISQQTRTLTIGFALTFQIYGSAISFETLGHDFLTPMRNRLLVSPIEPEKIVSSVLLTSVVVSYLQTLVILIFSMILLDATFPRLFIVLLVLLLSVIFHQLLGTVILFLSKKVKTATAITSLYGIVAPFIAGLYFPLPENLVTRFLKNFGTPMSLAQKGIMGIMEGNAQDIFIGVTPLIIFSVILFGVINPLSKKVIQ